MSGTEAKFEELKDLVLSLASKTDLDDKFGQLSKEVGQLSKEVGQLSKEVGQMDDKVGQLSKEVGQMKALQGRVSENSIRLKIQQQRGESFSKQYLMPSLSYTCQFIIRQCSGWDKDVDFEQLSKSVQRFHELLTENGCQLLLDYLHRIVTEMPLCSFKKQFELFCDGLTVSNCHEAGAAFSKLGMLLGDLDSELAAIDKYDEHGYLVTLKQRLLSLKFTLNTLKNNFNDTIAFTNCDSIGLPVFGWYVVKQVSDKDQLPVDQVLSSFGLLNICYLFELEFDVKGSIAIHKDPNSSYAVVEIGEIKQSFSGVTKAKYQLRLRLMFLKYTLPIVCDLDPKATAFTLIGNVFIVDHGNDQSGQHISVQPQVGQLSYLVHRC